MPKRIFFLIRRSPFETWISLAALVAAFVMFGRELAFFQRHPGPVAFDDGYTVAFAERIIDRSWLPYVDACSHRGPLLYWLTAVFQNLFGRFSWVGSRNLSFVLWFATITAVYVTAMAAKRRVAAGVGVLLLVWFAAVYDVPATFGVGGESIASPLTVFALALVTIALERLERLRGRAVLLFLAGSLAALAGLAKQTALPTIAPLALWTAAVWWSDRAEPGRRSGYLLLALGAGFVLPIVAVLARYAVAGHLGSFWYWYYVYNAEVYMAPHRADSFRTVFDRLFDHRSYALLGLAVLVIGSLLARIAALGPRPWQPAREYTKGGFELTLVWLTLLALLGALAPLRFFFHYFLPLFPLAALLVGVGIERTFMQAGGSRAAFAAASALVVVSLFAITLFAHDRLMRGLRESRKAGDWSGVYPEPVCDFIDAHSKPGSPLFIWGFDADVYVTCRRKPASRFVYLTLVAGVVPDSSWHEPNPQRVARDSRAQLLSDLEEAKPDVVLEILENMKGVSMSVAPEIFQHVDARYCRAAALKTKDGRVVTPWLLNNGQACP
ncbi:MAG: hypothetical protein IPI67_06790 [Myxococcales bacterium]|nr:hypothetical protein [Myxococcales bacterium]